MTSDWFDNLGRPQFVVAPMVDASELAWRLLCRNHAAQLCYTPMLHSYIFTKDSKYRKEYFTTSLNDRPLIVQFCGNDPDIMAAAAKLVENDCDAIDVNLGCPQSIAKRGRYGAFLQDDWSLLQKIVTAMSQAVTIPITCKVRVFDSIDKSVEYALMLQNAGCKLLTVHGRTREQKGPLTGIASWEHINAVRKAVSIPMFANGNIQCLEDVHRCINFTGVHGVMSAEGILTNPALFEGINPVTWEIAMEYLDLVEKFPCPSSFIRGHLFKIFHKIFTLESNNEDRELLARAQNLNDFKQVCVRIRQKYLPFHEGRIHFQDDDGMTRSGFDLILPPWICQPYVRISPEEHTQKMELCKQDNAKRIIEDADGIAISRKKMKKLRRYLRRPTKLDSAVNRNRDICTNDVCPNPCGIKCAYQLCKRCCRNKCYNEDCFCEGHDFRMYKRDKVKVNEDKTDINKKLY